jgi:hypothetical protein
VLLGLEREVVQDLAEIIESVGHLVHLAAQRGCVEGTAGQPVDFDDQAVQPGEHLLVVGCEGARLGRLLKGI